jgi:hypothetical protein
VLSLWDAAALDAAGQDGEVVPTFVNLTDASIKMVWFLVLETSGDRFLGPGMLMLILDRDSSNEHKGC